MKVFYELQVEDMRGAGLAMGFASTKTIKREQFDELYKAISEANKYHRENYPNHEKDVITFTAVGNGRWTSGDLLCVMYNINKKEIK